MFVHKIARGVPSGVVFIMVAENWRCVAADAFLLPAWQWVLLTMLGFPTAIVGAAFTTDPVQFSPLPSWQRLLAGAGICGS